MPKSIVTLAAAIGLVLGATTARAAPLAPGLDLTTTLKAEFVRNTARGAGQSETAILGNLDLILEFDAGEAWGDAAAGWRGRLYVLGNARSGPAPTEALGDRQATSNIEAPDDIKIYEAWLDRAFAEGRASVRAGLYDYNTEFAAIGTAGLFHLSSFGIPPDVSQIGPSIFPTTALALRVRWDPAPNRAVLAVVADGVPGHVRLDLHDGLFTGVQFEWAPAAGDEPEGPAGRWRLGAWHTTAPGERPTGEPIEDNHGVYASWEGPIGSSSATRAFAQAGQARPDRNDVSWYAGAGMTWTGLLDSRPDDVIGIGVARATLSSAARRAEPGLPSAETIVELVYRWKVNEFLALEPDLQWIDRPAGGPEAPRSAWRAAVRVVVGM